MVQECLPISVVIPTYNSGRFIEETVASILSQTVQCAEIIIVDDCSTDSTPFLLNKLKQLDSKKIRLHCLPDNVGSSEARNIGFRSAKEPWVLLMDHDDLAEPDLMEAEWARLQELEAQTPGKWVLAHSAYRQITETGDEIPGVHRWRQVGPGEILGYELVRNQVITNSGVLLKKDAVRKAGGYDPDIVYSQDWDLWLRIAQLGGFAYVDKPLVRIRRHPNNTSRKMSSFLEDERRILQKYSPNFIATAIDRRQLPWETNRTDLVAVLYRLGRWEQGYSILQEVNKQWPAFATGYFLKTLYYLNRNEMEEARLALEETLRLNPDHGAALNNLGALKAIRGEVEQAEKLLQKAISLFPGYLDARHNMEKLSSTQSVTLSDMKFTWRELRPVLVSYIE